MPFSLRLDPDTEARIRRLSAETGRSRSAVVREAVADYAASRDASASIAATAFDRLKRYGTVNSGGMDYSVDTHQKYREALLRKRRAKRSR
jgi:predicted DNA-binding protein